LIPASAADAIVPACRAELYDAERIAVEGRRVGQGRRIGEILEVLGESGHEHFNGSLVVPVIDAAGFVSEVYGRKIRDDLRKGTPKHLYLSEECRAGARGVFNVAALASSKEIIVCEALIDALTFWCAGYRNVTASYGTEGFTDAHLAAFKAHGTQRVLIAYDRDEPGERAAEKLAARLMAEGIECYRILFPKGMDANAYALAVQPAEKSLGIAIRKAHWLGKGDAPRDALLTLAAHHHTPDTEPPPTATAHKASKEEPAAPTPPLPPLPASPQPAAPAPEAPADVDDNAVRLAFGERHYRVRGLAKNTSPEILKINLLAACGERFHVDTFDLYAARARASFVTQAAIELRLTEDVLRADVGKILLKLEALQDERLRKTLAPAPVEGVQMSEEERRAALALLQAPDLIGRIVADMEAAGITGETTNKLVGYLAATSRKLANPLAIVIRSSSAAGKTSLMDAVLAMMPEEERIKYSAMTGQSRVLHGASQPEAQDPGAGRRRGSLPRQLCTEAVAVRRRIDDRFHRQGCRDRQPDHAGIPGRRAGHAVHHHHGAGHRPRTIEPLSGADRR